MRRDRIIFSTLLAVVISAGPSLASEPAAEIVQSVFNVGSVVRGVPIEQVFEIRNTGDAPLEILDVGSSCGCAVADFDRQIAAGVVGRVNAVVTTDKLEGPIAKSVTVFTSDPRNPRLDLIVKANVKVHIVAQPGYARFVQIQGEPPTARTTILWSDSFRNLQVERVETPYPFLEVRYRQAEPQERLVDREGRQWAIVSSLPADAPVGPLADYLVIHTNHPRQPQFRLPVQGFMQPAIAVTPRVADVGRQSLDTPYLVTLEVKNQGSEPIEVTAATSDVPGVETKIETKEVGRLFKVLVTLRPGLPKGEFDGVVRLQTSSLIQPVIEIDLRGTIL